MRHALVLALVSLALAGCGGGSSSTASAPPSADPPTTTAATRAVTTWWDAERLRPQSAGTVAVDASGAEVKVGDWVWWFDQDGSPVRRVERFAADGRSLSWTEYNADAIDPVTRRGSIRDDSSDGVER